MPTVWGQNSSDVNMGEGRASEGGHRSLKLGKRGHGREVRHRVRMQIRGVSSLLCRREKIGLRAGAQVREEKVAKTGEGVAGQM